MDQVPFRLSPYTPAMDPESVARDAADSRGIYILVDTGLTPEAGMLRNVLSESLKEAMRAKDKCATATLRLVLAALKDRDIAARADGKKTEVDDTEVLSMLETMVKQRRESIKMYEQGERPELAEQEQDEIEIIERFLPKQLNDSEVEAAVGAAIDAAGADSLKQMGKVMAALRERYAGQMDFGKAGAIAKQRLS